MQIITPREKVDSHERDSPKNKYLGRSSSLRVALLHAALLAINHRCAKHANHVGSNHSFARYIGHLWCENERELIHPMFQSNPTFELTYCKPSPKSNNLLRQHRSSVLTHGSCPEQLNDRVISQSVRFVLAQLQSQHRNRKGEPQMSVYRTWLNLSAFERDCFDACCLPEL